MVQESELPDVPTSVGMWMGKNDMWLLERLYSYANDKDQNVSQVMKDSVDIRIEIERVLDSKELYFPNKREKIAWLRQAVIDHAEKSEGGVYDSTS